MKRYDNINECIQHDCVLIDVSRIINRSVYKTPTGIDRLDLIFMDQIFSEKEAVIPVCRIGKNIGILDHSLVRDFLHEINEVWMGNGKNINKYYKKIKINLFLQRAVPLRLNLERLKRKMDGQRAAYVCMSHSGIPIVNRLLDKLMKQVNIEPIIYIHDIIPIEYPEYTTEKSKDRFINFIKNSIKENTKVVVNSEFTANSLSNYIKKEFGINLEKNMDIVVPRLDWLSYDKREREINDIEIGKPYFIVISTLEPRKNHILLLNIWRKWAKGGMENIPHLYLVGRRGWENEHTFRFLDRCEAIHPWVHELGSLPQTDMIALLKGANALLMPSFVEGLGLPVLEALSLDVPVIASDIEIFREMKNTLRNDTKLQLIDPLDAKGWENAILSYIERD